MASEASNPYAGPPVLPGTDAERAAVSYCSGRDSEVRTVTEIDSPSVRAPDFPANLDWIHTGGRRLTLADFRGKLLFLDFWTYG
jgi:hypothetical protein